MKVVFIFSSPSDKSPEKLLKPYINESISYDIKYLCSEVKDKVLKKDIDLDIEQILEDYQIVCPVGAEPLKYVAKLTGITKYNGVFIEKKFIPFINPNMIIFKPQYQKDLIDAGETLNKVVSGTLNSEIFDKDYKLISTQKEYDDIKNILDKSKYLVVDLETSSLSPRNGNIIGLVLSTKPHQGYYIDASLIQPNKLHLQTLFLNKSIVFHNSKFDIKFLQYEYGFSFIKFDDTMLMHYCLEETLGTHGLKDLAMRFTDLGDYNKELEDYKKSFCRKNKILLRQFNYGMLPLDILAPYGMKDGDATAQLYEKFKPLIDKNNNFSRVYYEILIPATKAVIKLENNGGPIDLAQLSFIEQEYTIDIEECLNEIELDPNVLIFEKKHNKTFNPNSTKQLQELFFEIMKLTPVKKTATGAWSVDKEVLAVLDHPLCEAIRDLREKTKMLSTYISSIRDAIDNDSRLRSGFNLQGTTSGRLSSSGALNYQNIPRDNKDIKKLFRARKGYKIIQCDLGTAEVYVAAVLSNDEFLQKAFTTGLDFHSYIAKQVFNLPCEVQEVKSLYPDQRQYAKAITFGIMYQAGPAKIAEEAEVTIKEAVQLINKYFKEAFNLKKYIEKNNNSISNNAFIYSEFGRKRRLPEALSPNKGTSKHAIRSGLNFLFQSVASDINLLGLIDLMEWIAENKYEEAVIPFTIVHDSIVSEVREDLVDEYSAKVKYFLQKDRGCSIPNCPIKIDVEVGESWGELESYNDYKQAA